MKLELSRLPILPTPAGRLPFRILTALDLAGLILCYAYLELTGRGAADASFNLNLAVVGLLAWLLTAQFRSLKTILTHSRDNVLGAPVIAAALTVAMRTMTKDYYSVEDAFVFAALWFVWMIGWRVIRQRHLPSLRVLAFGTQQFVAELEALPNVALTIADTPPDSFEGIDVVALDPTGFRGEEWLRWLMHADMAGVKLIAAPLVVETITRQLPLEALHGRWAHFLLERPRHLLHWKRAMDLAIVLLVAPLAILLTGIVCLAVLLLDGRPIFFLQDRIGRYGRPFKMIKIRSMVVDAERSGAAFASRNDSRVTRVGSFIRRCRLDELPQLLNVLKGEMSVVGPRPEQVMFSKAFESTFSLYSLRHNLRPGITGWAQIRNGYASGDAENYGKLRHDLYYVRHVSLALDVAILLRTVSVIISGFGAR